MCKTMNVIYRYKLISNRLFVLYELRSFCFLNPSLGVTFLGDS